ncbi:MAG: Alanine racemase [Candidatus Tokpelaia hoelldobleri]|uniref:Alanine racemase n=1 Tax=Candidatus Tokpelaia hoelldobleri TaxID=1902579 RepID=A0A1U9JSN2_9HYPH|nr:MAG: Alanine racemase [Candidatus Tokpelaia hoelldoblerii]
MKHFPETDMNEDERACGAVLSIDLDALRHNYLTLCQQARPAQVSAVVKADAYGTGANHVAPVLYEAGCRVFFVAQLAEAFSLRKILAPDATIAVLNDIQPGMAAATAEAGILPVINSLDSAAEWLALCRSRQQKLPALVQIDTGMARLGLSLAELAGTDTLHDLFSAADIRFIISHLACGDEPDSSMNAAQLEHFKNLIAALPARPLALANSGGVFLGKDYCFNLVRPGIALYGIDPLKRRKTPLRPVVRLEARVIQTRQVPAHTKIGYGSTFTTQRPSWVSTIAVGYADGWLRCLSNKGAAWYKGTRLPIIGRVSMDSITLDTTALKKAPLKRGDLVELIGPQQSVEDVARDAGTIPYEILTSLGPRYARHYLRPR